MSQEKSILEYLQAGNRLTPLEALSRFNCWALSSRIADLNRKGAGIQTKMVSANGKSFAQYFIEFPVDQKGQRLMYV
jgi:hypothetical protein